MAWQAPAAHVPLLPTRDLPTAGESFRRLLLAVVAVGMGAASVAVVDKAGRGHVQLRTHHEFAKMSVSDHRRARDAPASPRPALAHGRCKDAQRRHNKGHDAPCPCSRAPSSGRRTGQCRRVRSSCPRRARREEGPAPPMPWGAVCHRTARPRGTRASHRPCHLQGRHAAMIRSESRARGLDVQLGGALGAEGETLGCDPPEPASNRPSTQDVRAAVHAGSHRRHSALVPLRPAVPPSPSARTGQSPTSAKASAGGLAAQRARWNVGGALTDEAAVGVEPKPCQHRQRKHCKHGGGDHRLF